MGFDVHAFCVDIIFGIGRDNGRVGRERCELATLTSQRRTPRVSSTVSFGYACSSRESIEVYVLGDTSSSQRRCIFYLFFSGAGTR